MYLPIGMTFDIEKLIRTDPIFRPKLEKSVKNVIATSAALHKKMTQSLSKSVTKL